MKRLKKTVLAALAVIILLNITGGSIESSGERIRNNLVERDDKMENDIAILIGASYAKGLGDNEITSINLINKGIGGDQSSQMLSRFNKDVVSQNPKYVIIWGFINDFFRSNREEMATTIEKAKKNIIEMIQLSQGHNIKPIIATELTVRGKDSYTETIAKWIGTIMGKRSYQDYINDQVLSMNAWLKDYADKHNILLIDINAALSDSNEIRKKEYAAKDGSHISEKGYQKLMDYLHRYFETNLNG